MEECGPEEFAQLQYNNVKLQDELDELKKHALFIEENYNSLLSTSSQKEDYIKSLEQQVNSTFQTLKQNKSIIEILEVDNEKYKKLLDELSLANQTLKKELNEELEILRIEAEECRLSHIKIKEENERLLSQLSSKRTENSFNKSVVRDLKQKNKELEDEKLELILLNETLQHHLSIEKAKNAEKFQDRFVVEEDWSPEKSQPTFQNLNVKQQQQQKENLNLREEILEAEIAEKSCLITRLESLLWEKYEENLRLSALVEKLQNRNQSLNLISAVNSDRRTGPVCLLKEIHMNPKKIINSVYMDDMGNETCPSLSLTFLFDGHRVLPKLITRPGGQSGEIRNLTEVTTFGVIKNEVETRQPGSISVVETISIASQTDPIKNLSPVLPFKGFQNSHSKETHSPLHSDEEAQRLEIIEEMELCKNRHVFFGHRNCDLDMDLFRTSKAPEAPVSSNRRISNGIPNSNAVIQGAEAKENEGNRKVKTHFNSSFNAIKSKKTREMTEECCPGAQGDCSNNDLVQQILRMFSGQLENLELLRKLTSNVTDKGTLQKYQSSPCCAQGPMNGYCVNVDTPIGLAYQENENKTPEKERCSPSKKELMTSESHHPRNVNNNIVEDGEGEKSVSSEISAEEANGKAFEDRGRAWKWKTIGSFCRFLTKLLVFALLFLTGALTGMNGFFSYTHVKYASLWLGVVIFLTLARRFYRFLFVISSVLGLQLVILVVWVGPLLVAHLTEEEMNKLFRPFHPFLQVRYANGPPPV